MEDITKSTRHSKIAGSFGEMLVTYMLSKKGYECGIFDHIGVDIVARNLDVAEETLGISVKCRTRSGKTIGTSLDVTTDHVKNLEGICLFFGWKPYMALVIDEGGIIKVYFMHLEKFKDSCTNTKEAETYHWSMSKKKITEYLADGKIKKFEYKFKNVNW